MGLMLLIRVSKRLISSEAGKEFLKIGNVRVPIKQPKNPELVPAIKPSSSLSQITLGHLKWLLQKDLLRQDVFLLGVPGSSRSAIVLEYLAAVNREYEYLAVTRDTTEADIKQRREIRNGSAFYTDLCAVRAALNGRVLVIDGVEKAERNVLPIINNLLENREMQLDDGRFLMHHQTFDKLKEKYTETELRDMGVERVSPEFHVVAFGLPVPRFAGHTLDPPLRSRFQCRHVLPPPFQVMLDNCKALSPSVPSAAVNQLVSMVYSANSQTDLQLPLIPADNLERVMRIWNTNPGYSAEFIFRILYPIDSVLRSTDLEAMNRFLEKFEIKDSSKYPVSRAIRSVLSEGHVQKVAIGVGPTQITVEIPTKSNPNPDESFVKNDQHESLLADLAVAFSHGDFTLLGPKGSGKTKIIETLGKRLGFCTETMVLYQDMNSRELVQRRHMLENGDTIWEDSQLVSAAKAGHVCVLDGAERVHWSAIESLSSLIHHRRLDLPDGSRLVSEEEFARLQQKSKHDKEELIMRKIYPIPSSFRLLLVGDSETSDSKWINDAVLALMPFYTLEPLTVDNQCNVIENLVPEGNPDIIRQLVTFVDKLRGTHDAGIRGVAISLSLRKLIHLVKRDSLHDGELRSLVEKAALSKFLPSVTKTAFLNALEAATIIDTQKIVSDAHEDITALRRESHENISDETMVPDVLFYENDQHVSVMRDMARDMRLGAHLLLIGNQGVGKNKITDRFLYLINRPRHYIQLHRDTTVESLTTQCTVEAGLVRHEDSALVRAARSGHVLVIDEADKAPLHVIAVLKSLLDSGTLLLSDGRRLQPAHLPQNDKTIPVHPEFRIIMLANRPGFPFLGNDLFGVLGDLFSIHTVENPDRESEIVMLKKYAPDIDESSLMKLVTAFDELRNLADEGTLQYPYSTRELVNICKHLNRFPDDPLTTVVGNVLDFDQYSSEAVKVIEEVFRRHGIPLGIERPQDRVFLSNRFEIPPMQTIGHWGVADNVVPTTIEARRTDMKIGDPVLPESQFDTLTKEHMRVTQFTEQVCSWQIPMLDVNIVSDGIFIDDRLLVAAVNPMRLYAIKDLENTTQVEEIDLSSFISTKSPRQKFQPRVRFSEFGDDHVLIHEETTNALLTYGTRTGRISTIDCDPGVLHVINKYLHGEDNWRMVAGKQPLLFERGGQRIVLPNRDLTSTHLELQQKLSHVVNIGDRTWLLKFEDGSMSILRDEDGSWKVRPVSVDADLKVGTAKVTEDAGFASAKGYYFVQSDSFPRLMSSSDIRAVPRPPLKDSVDHRRPHYLSDENTAKFLDPNRNLIALGDGVLVQALPRWEVPKDGLPGSIPSTYVAGFLEVIDTKNLFVQYVPIPQPKYQSYHGNWLATISKEQFIIVPWGDEKLVTIDSNGGIRSYELSQAVLGKSINSWRNMIGGDEGALRMQFQREGDVFDITKLDEPIIGKFDPENNPHVGGNQWMGGTGGYNTAGLGGVGGPFRLDAGHDVHQMPEYAKQQIPQHLIDKAREIAKAEYARKLKEIKMSEYDADAYESLWNKVQSQSGRLKAIVESLEARKKERQWVRHQTSGDLDDSKVIEGIAGEKNVYRKRADKLPEPGTPQEKPKRLRLIFDVSGSMYRFNGYDKRLQRSLEAALMVMKSMENKESKVLYEIHGHSGDSPCTQFVNAGKYPANNKERLDVLKAMLTHTQYCSSGDFTLEALDLAIKDVEKQQDCDEKIVVLVSDANLDRYGIRPRHLTEIMNRSDDVQSFVILIGSLGEQAERIQRSLPAGKAFVCKDTGELPQIMQNIFASTLL